MSQNKTVPQALSVSDFLESAPDRRKPEAEQLLAWMQAISGEPPVMWGSSLVGFGSYHYRYDSGREGDFFRIGFSPRKAKLTLYILPGFEDAGPLLDKLGKHSTGKSCLYLNKLTDADPEVLQALIQHAWNTMERRYPRD